MGTRQSTNALLGQIFLDMGLLTQPQLQQCIGAHRIARKLGLKSTLLKIAIDLGFLSEEQEPSVRRELIKRGVRPILGRYELVKKLGGGGMGAVYMARQLRFGRVVAVKILHSQFARSRGFLARFYREARLAAQLSHPNVVRVFDVVADRGKHFIVMEYVDGVSLERLLRLKPLEEKLALRIARDVALGLSKAHARKIVHRDVKPANILISSEGMVKLSDLGLAKYAAGESGSITRSGGIIGTPRYMSPEQCAGEKRIDYRTDIYSLGISLYEMVCGRPPYGSPSGLQVMRDHVEKPLPDPTKATPALSAATAELIRDLAAKAPRDRLQSCAEVIRRIDAVLDRRIALIQQIDTILKGKGAELDEWRQAVLRFAQETDFDEGPGRISEEQVTSACLPDDVPPSNGDTTRTLFRRRTGARTMGLSLLALIGTGIGLYLIKRLLFP